MTEHMGYKKKRNEKAVQRPVNKVRLCCISDLHEQWDALTIPYCDILVIAGDLTYLGAYDKLVDFNNWCAKLKESKMVKEIIFIAGNHDLTAQRDPETWKTLITNAVYLEDEEVTVMGIRFYGSPWTPSFGRDHWVFNADRGNEIREKWDKIPEGVDVLITHGPAYGVGDLVPRGEHTGCWDLRTAILEKQPRVHVCGHIHEGYGIAQLGVTTVINAASCNGDYKPINPPIVIDLMGL